MNPAPWVRLIGRANEDKSFIDKKPVTALLDTGSQVTHVSHDSVKKIRSDIQPISQIVNIEGTGDDIIDYLGYIEARFSQPTRKKLFEVDACLLVLPTTEHHSVVDSFYAVDEPTLSDAVFNYCDHIVVNFCKLELKAYVILKLVYCTNLAKVVQ